MEENIYEIECFYDNIEVLEEKIFVNLEFVDTIPVAIKEFGYIFRIVNSLPRIGEIVSTGSSWSFKELNRQYKIVDIKTYYSFHIHKVFYLKRLDVIEKEKEYEKKDTIVQI